MRPIPDSPLSTGSLRRWWPVAALAAIALAGLGFVIVHPEALFNRHSDLLAENLATETILHDTWQAEHRLPLWRSDLLSGRPALTNPQALYTHPVHLLFALFEPARVVGLVIWLQMLLAAIGAYYAAVVLRVSIPARLLVAVAMLFSFKVLLTAYAGWLTMLAGIAAMPMVFATAAVAIERPSWRSGLVAGLAGAWALHAGNPQITCYVAVLLVPWVVGRTGRLLVRRDVAAAGRLAAGLTVATAVAIGLAAYLLIPLAFDAPLLTRGAATYDFFVGPTPFTVRGLWTMLNPEVFGTPMAGTYETWEYSAYFGATATPLALLGAVRGWRRPFVPLLVAGLVLSVALAIETPLLRLVFAMVPGYGLFRLPARMLIVSAFFVACLAGVGLDELRAAARARWSRRAVAFALIGMVALEGAWWARRYLHVDRPVPYPIVSDYVASLSSAAAVARVAPMSRALPAAGLAVPLGLQLVTGYDAFNFRHYQTYMDLLQFGRPLGARATIWTDLTAIARPDMLAALNVMYVVDSAPVTLPDFMLVDAFQNQPQFRFYEGVVHGPVYVYRNERFLSRAFFARDVQGVNGDADMIRAVEHADVRETAVADGVESAASPPSPDDRVEVLHAEGGVLDLAVRNQARRFLVISEVWHPGWRATIDDVPAALHRTDIALQGLWLPPGDHRVALRFWPPGLTAGLAITSVTMCGVLASFVITLRRRRRTDPT